MNILMVHPHDVYSRSEPWTVRIVYLAREFVKKGHRVQLVYFPLEWHRQGPSMLGKDITAIPLPRTHGPHVLIANIMRVVTLARRADIVHFQKCFYHAALPALLAAVMANKPVHYDWDDWELKIYEVSTKPGALRNLVRLFLGTLENSIPRLVDTVSTASKRLRDKCEKLGCGSAMLFDAHVGADIDAFHPRVSGACIREKFRITAPLVLYLGQLHGGQYVELFIKTAARLIRERKEELLFMIVGDGYQANELKKLSLQLGLDGKLIFAGAVSHDIIPQYIAAADVCVACFEENEVTACKSPLKIVEYMAMGKAIVASRVGEVPLMLGGAGLLVPPGDVASLAQGIIRIIQDKTLKVDLEKQARRRSEDEYNWGVTAGHILAAYAKALTIKKRRRNGIA